MCCELQLFAMRFNAPFESLQENYEYSLALMTILLKKWLQILQILKIDCWALTCGVDLLR